MPFCPPDMTPSLTHHQLVISWQLHPSPHSSLPVSRTCGHKSDDMTTISIFKLKPKVSWCNVHIWTPLWTWCSFWTVWRAQKSNSRTPLRFRSGVHSSQSHPSRCHCCCQQKGHQLRLSSTGERAQGPTSGQWHFVTYSSTPKFGDTI